MINATTIILTDTIREAAHPLTGSGRDYDFLMDLIADAQFVLR